MRPPPGNDSTPPTRSRKPSICDNVPHLASPSSVPTTFFFRTEDELDRPQQQQQQSPSPSPSPAPSNPRLHESNYGVQSLEDALTESFGDKGDGESRPVSIAVKGKRGKNDATHQAPKTSSGGGLPTGSASAASEMINRASPLGYGSKVTASLPLTPLTLGSPESGVPSTPKSMSVRSFQLSDEGESSGVDEVASQAVVSASGSEDETEEHGNTASGFPELVMPSIQMPSRRPFTAKGKSIGRLRVLIAGQKGVGKTLLIKSMVQLCEDIVHVDPLSSYQPNLATTSPDAKSRQKKVDKAATVRIAEIHASTKAYPPWWTEMEEVKVLRRRRNMGDTVLDRNVCFVDTPGLEGNPGDSDHVTEYIESLLQKDASITSLQDGDLLAIYSGNGGVHVDVVLYLFAHDKDPAKEFEYFQRLSALTNVVPLISKADALSPAQLASLKVSILSLMQRCPNKPFLFGNSLDSSIQRAKARAAELSALRIEDQKVNETQVLDNIPPYAVSSTPCADSEVMDASLLMSPDYVEPLVASDLSTLVSRLFEPDNVSWLRHSAAKKLLHWRRAVRMPSRSMTAPTLDINPRDDSGVDTRPLLNRSQTIDPFNMQSPFGAVSTTSSIISSPSPSQVLVSHPSASTLYSPPSVTPIDGRGISEFTLARLRDHTQREERLAQVRLAKWAADLQRSLQNERERFEQLQRAERARWLLERMSEEVRDGNIVSSSPSRAPRSYTARRGLGVADWALAKKPNRNHKQSSKIIIKDGEWWGEGSNAMDPRDPLGLCEWSDGIKKGSVVVLQVLGGVGIVGAVVVAVVHTICPEAIAVEGIWTWLSRNLKVE